MEPNTYEGENICNFTGVTYLFKWIESAHTVYTDSAAAIQTINGILVKGHSGYIWNEKVDGLAKLASTSLRLNST
ncbi:hypothetical protein RhiirB3_533451 [Rhizophagus irregularis]|nr:hypothetical protein RhiirB3_533451 [Rhizophagus irregularis]